MSELPSDTCSSRRARPRCPTEVGHRGTPASAGAYNHHEQTPVSRHRAGGACRLDLDPSRALGVASGGGTVALATADLEAHVVALEVADGPDREAHPHVDAPRSIESSPFGQVVVAHTPIGALSILDAATLSVRAVLRGLGEPRYTAMHPGEAIAYVTDSGRREVLTVDLDSAGDRPPAHASPARLATSLSTRADPLDGARLAANRIAVLDLSDPRRPRLARVLEPPFPAHDVVFAPDGGHVWVTSGARNALALYPLAGGAPRVLATGAPPQHVAFSDSRAYVACGRDGTVQRRRLDGSAVARPACRTARTTSRSARPSGHSRGRRRSSRRRLTRARSPCSQRGAMCALCAG